jgi:hypothetical protein
MARLNPDLFDVRSFLRSAHASKLCFAELITSKEVYAACKAHSPGLYTDNSSKTKLYVIFGSLDALTMRKVNNVNVFEPSQEYIEARNRARCLLDSTLREPKELQQCVALLEKLMPNDVLLVCLQKCLENDRLSLVGGGTSDEDSESTDYETETEGNGAVSATSEDLGQMSDDTPGEKESMGNELQCDSGPAFKVWVKRPEVRDYPLSRAEKQHHLIRCMGKEFAYHQNDYEKALAQAASREHVQMHKNERLEAENTALRMEVRKRKCTNDELEAENRVLKKQRTEDEMIIARAVEEKVHFMLQLREALSRVHKLEVGTSLADPSPTNLSGTLATFLASFGATWNSSVGEEANSASTPPTACSP